MSRVSRISSITVVTHLGSKSYHLGEEHNGRILEVIKDYSYKYNNVFFSCYTGCDKDGRAIFRIENAPVMIEYVPDKDEASTSGVERMAAESTG